MITYYSLLLYIELYYCIMYIQLRLRVFFMNMQKHNLGENARKMVSVKINHSLLVSEQELSKHEAKDKDEYGRMDMSHFFCPGPIYCG